MKIEVKARVLKDVFDNVCAKKLLHEVQTCNSLTRAACALSLTARGCLASACLLLFQSSDTKTRCLNPRKNDRHHNSIGQGPKLVSMSHDAVTKIKKYVSQ